jgi:hypothetical protein
MLTGLAGVTAAAMTRGDIPKRLAIRMLVASGTLGGLAALPLIGASH